MIKLFDYQEEALRLTIEHERFALFMEQGTGKTMVAIKAIEHFYNTGSLNHIIIFCPKPIIYNWLLELEKFLDVPFIIETLDHRKKEKRDEAMKEFQNKETNELKILLLNYEKANILKKELMKFKAEYIIMDESHKLKGRSTKTGRAIYSLTKKCDYTLLMTGTPILNGLEDIFNQFKIMDDTILGTRWKDFEDHFIIRGGYMGKEVVGYRNENDMEEIISKHSFRVKLDDVTELPPMNMKYHIVDLSKDATKSYKELNKEMVTQIEYTSSEVSRSKLKNICRMNGIQYHPRERYYTLLLKAKDFINVTSADLVVTQLIKLQQITGGFLKQDDGTTIQLDHSKIKATEELVNESTRPVLIFCRFISEIYAIKESLSTTKRVEVYRGKNRKEIYDQFQKGEIDVLILQIQSGSLGLNLQRANRIIFYSWNFSSGDYVQAIARIKRNGQKNPMEVIHLIADKTIDDDILKTLSVKREIAKKLLRD